MDEQMSCGASFLERPLRSFFGQSSVALSRNFGTRDLGRNFLVAQRSLGFFHHPNLVSGPDPLTSLPSQFFALYTIHNSKQCCHAMCEGI